MVANIILLVIVAFFVILAGRKVWADHKNGVNACGYACGGECNGSCSMVTSGTLPNGKKLSDAQVKEVRAAAARMEADLAAKKARRN